MNGIFPNKLKFAKVIPIFKKGTTDLLINLPPISYLLFLNKVFERVIYNRLISFNVANAIVSTQYGFRHNRTTTHAIFDLITACNDDMNINKF